MDQYTVSTAKYTIIFVLVIGIIAALLMLPLLSTWAQNNQDTKPVSFGESLSKGTMCSAGLNSCDKNSQNKPSSSGLLFGIFGGSSARAKADPIITVVNVPGQNAVYRIINGQKHSIPTTEIFESYGFSLEIVQAITQQQLDRYPSARLFMLEPASEDEVPTVYYLTDGGTIRPILNDKVFYSYGNRKEDVIVINQKELNFYPRNQFIFINKPKLDRDIYQISGGIKKYLTPVAVKRMNIQEYEIAPVNQIEFDEYPTGEPVLF